MPHVKIGNLWLHYRDEGEGEPLVLLMGFGAPLQGWDPQIPALSRRFRVIRIDNRGVGRSDKPLGPYSVAQLVGDTIGLLDHLGIAKAHLVGLSMGGMAAMECAARHPERVRSLVLAATTAAADAKLRWIVGTATARVTAAMALAQGDWERRLEAGKEELIRIWLPLVFSSSGGGEAEAMLRRLMDESFVDGFSASGTAGQMIACLLHDARPRLSLVQAPTLVLGGTDDGLFSTDVFEALAKGIPNARLELVDGAPHCLNMVEPEPFNDWVLRFCSGGLRYAPTSSSIPSLAPSTTRVGESLAARF